MEAAELDSREVRRPLPSPELPLPVLTPASTAVHPGPWGSKEVGMGVGVEVVELLLLLTPLPPLIVLSQRSENPTDWEFRVV